LFNFVSKINSTFSFLVIAFRVLVKRATVFEVFQIIIRYDLHEVHVDFVHVGPLLTVDLDVDVVLIHDVGCLERKVITNSKINYLKHTNKLKLVVRIFSVPNNKLVLFSFISLCYLLHTYLRH
jgi:hypothetical protein